MNNVSLMGRLTRDPEIKYSESSSRANFTLAVDRDFKKEGQPTADFIRCVVFGKKAEFTEKYLHKGMKIAVTGRIQTSSYEKDGRRYYTTDVFVEKIEFAESKAASSAQSAPSQEDEDGFMNIAGEISTESLPFR